MLNLDQIAPSSRPSAGERDPRMVARATAFDVPVAGLLGRRAFALAPWIVISIIALAFAAADVLRSSGTGPGHRLDPFLIGTAIALAVASGVMAAVQDLPAGQRYRHRLWAYALGGLVVLVVLASFALRDEGVTSPVFSAVCPLALYMGMVAPPVWRYRTLAVLFAATIAVQLAVPADAWFDAVVVWVLIVAAWACGVLVSVGQARTALIIRRMSRFDRPSRSLSRRGFMEQLEWSLRPDAGPDGPVALFVLDADLARLAALDGDDGAAILRWIGTVVAETLPADAEFGRLSDGEFGIFVRGIDRRAALDLAEALQMTVAAKVPASIGVASSETRAVGASDLFRVADAARAVAASDGRGVHALVAGTIRSPDWDPGAEPHARRPKLRFADLRLTGKAPRVVEEVVMNRRIATLSTVALLLAGVPIVARGILDGGTGLADDVVRFAGVPWLLWVGVTAVATYRWATGAGTQVERLLHLSSSLALTIGVSVAALAEEGLTSPIAAAFFLKVLFDATVFRQNRSRFGLGLVLVAWGVVAGLGPADALWVLPFHLALFAGCFALGRLGREAMDDTAQLARDRARIDDLTGLATRSAFLDEAGAAFYRSATSTGQPFAVLSIRLEGLRAYNELRGYAAGDALLIHVADLLFDRIGVVYEIGRTGGTEFSVAVMAGAHAADGIVRDLEDTIGGLVAVRVACAACPRDGATVEALMLAAERAAGAPRHQLV